MSLFVMTWSMGLGGIAGSPGRLLNKQYYQMEIITNSPKFLNQINLIIFHISNYAESRMITYSSGYDVIMKIKALTHDTRVAARFSGGFQTTAEAFCMAEETLVSLVALEMGEVETIFVRLLCEKGC